MGPENPPSIPLDRATLKSAPWESLHPSQAWTQASIHALEWEGQPLVIKDFGDRGWLARHTIGRWTIRKEARVYKMLEGIEGIPKVHGVIEGPALVMERLPVKHLPKERRGSLTTTFFDELDRLLAEMHSRGVGHGDMRRKNILIGEDGHPHLIDFTTACRCPNGTWWPKSAIFRQIVVSDRIKVLRIRQEYLPGMVLSAEQRQLLRQETWIHRFLRRMRHDVYRPFKKKVLRR